MVITKQSQMIQIISDVMFALSFTCNFFISVTDLLAALHGCWPLCGLFLCSCACCVAHNTVLMLTQM